MGGEAASRPPETPRLSWTGAKGSDGNESRLPEEERRLTDRRRPESSDLGEVGGFLAEGIHLRGALHFSGAFRVDGHFEGEHVHGETLVIGEHGLVDAEIRVEILQVSGQVLGNVTAKRWVELLESSTLTGAIRTPRLTIWKGAVFNGTCDMPAAQPPESDTPLA